MSTVIVLSSSPARVFARSQTPIASPPTTIGDKTPTSSDRFRPSDLDRDSFSTKFVSARKVLGARSGAENIPIRSPRRQEGKLSSRAVRYTSPLQDRITVPSVSDDLRTRTEIAETDNDTKPIVVQIQPSDLRKNRRKKSVTLEPLQLEKALARRKEWTPPKTKASLQVDDLAIAPSIGLGERLASFGHSTSDTSFERSNADDGALVKRRRLDLVHTGLESCALKPQPPKLVKKRSKSPAKKPLTITDLATSNYIGARNEAETPMMQFLASTQARMDDDDEGANSTTKVKRGLGKKALPRSRLKSPNTVMRTIQQQEIIFASASQLAREESPSLLKDTIEAMKQSEQLLSDHLPSQQTEIISVESGTPKIGTSKFWGQRSLWAAGDRDGDNALIHVSECVDLSLHQATDPFHDDATGEKMNAHDETTFDLDDIVLPTTIRRAYPGITKRLYTTKASTEPGMSTEVDADEAKSVPIEGSKPTIRKSTAKPNYEGWTDEQLKKQVKAYGFKRIRARKRCIEILEECWRSMNNTGALADLVSEAGSEPGVALQHAAVLSNVHDLKVRPTPKVKKPRANTAKVTKDEPKSKPKRSREKTGDHDKSLTKKPRGRPPKTQSQSKAVEAVVDIDDIKSQTSGREVQARASTPGITDTAGDADDSDAPLMSVARPNTRKKRRSPSAAASTTPQLHITGLPDLPDLKLQILPALRHTSKANTIDDTTTKHSHQTHPTWHQKILMYDPIVLEDFTAWLNTAGFNAIGEDREIDILDVRAWLEGNSICCLWKGGWRGNGNRKGKELE